MGECDNLALLVTHYIVITVHTCSPVRGMLHFVNTNTETRNAHRVLVRNLEERHHLYDLDIDERMILNWILKK
jgi:hypothetical protein